MDKVIIDGVDVSGCERLENTYCKLGAICKGKDCTYKQLQRAKAELKKYEDMAKKGLEEFKDIGGCWGCGLQLQLNQDIEDIKKLKAENDNLKDDIDKQQLYVDSLEQENEELRQIRKDIPEIQQPYVIMYRNLKKELHKLQAEYDELYKYNVALENDYRDLEQENKQLKKLKFKSDGIELLQDANLSLHKANVKYRQALQEIRDIARE